MEDNSEPMRENAPKSDTDSRRNHGMASRRTFLTAGTGVALAFAGCTDTQNDGGGGGVTATRSQKNPYKGKTLRTTCWSGDYADRFRKTIKKRYEEETGATLRVLPGWSELLSKIRAAPKDKPPYDVTVADGYFYYQGSTAGLFEEVRYDNIPNYEGVYPFLKEFRSDNNKYGVPVDGEPMALSYSTDLGWTPKEWDDLAGEKASNVTIDGGFYAYPMQIGAIMADEVEATGEMYDEQYHDAPWNALKQIPMAKWYGSGAEIWQLFRQGVADMGQYYFSTSLAKARDDKTPIDISVPESTGGYFDNYCVVRGTNNRGMAEHFLNFLLDPEVQTMWSEISWEIKSHRDTEYPDFVEQYIPTDNENISKLNLPKWKYLTDYSDTFSQMFKETKRSN